MPFNGYCGVINGINLLQYYDDNTTFPIKDGKVDVDFGTDLIQVWKVGS